MKTISAPDLHYSKKTLGLDIGDVWTGSALSDTLGITAQPYKTVKTTDLTAFIQQTIEQHRICQVIIGYPKTMRGTESDQTKKVVAHQEQLQKQFPNITWLLWDERLSSKRAATQINTKKPEDRLRAHSIAAAFILSSFLESQSHFSDLDL